MNRRDKRCYCCCEKEAVINGLCNECETMRKVIEKDKERLKKLVG